MVFLLLIFVVGFYWVQVVIGMSGHFAFCTACHHQYATMELKHDKVYTCFEQKFIKPLLGKGVQHATIQYTIAHF